jgi:hypothetical protein
MFQASDSRFPKDSGLGDGPRERHVSTAGSVVVLGAEHPMPHAFRSAEDPDAKLDTDYDVGYSKGWWAGWARGYLEGREDEREERSR